MKTETQTKAVGALAAIGGSMIGSGVYRHNEPTMWVGGALILIAIVMAYLPSK